MTDQATIEANRQRQFIGSPARVGAILLQLASDVRADELMVNTMIHGKAERQRSYELLAQEWGTES